MIKGGKKSAGCTIVKTLHETDKILVFHANSVTLPSFTITQLYRCRWQVELFFRWIKQNLPIKTFYGTSGIAVKAQI
ncbi:transposase [Geomonas sp. Red875]|uniref:Transposase n=1 Tax=Geomesophilobacter sediminis TaxID=2798584 RepID=A0A8J7IWW2_9BACT|nr:transposase [Geomesophilobacter sediminis]